MDNLDRKVRTSKTCSKATKGLWIGGAVLLTAVLLKKDWRDKLISEATELKKCSVNAYEFVKDNREQIIEQVRHTANEVSEVVRGISDDVKKIGESAAHLKESSEELIKTTKESAQEIKELKIKNHE
ncbi:hypothetical protein AJ85_18165 [Alkalihalobacillus alcalophilus ATCC 27647 = CGMCC 1.3604]|uniref:General stress protein n=1 Tax=Alkalihalobacillus alcalophilus ATCC 27647 = CGMCC 1.3604 TaxID=1218173 RepID=A0A094WLI0_ALKAL|nr:hypothetical protein [Alkalihalobacillus alcalophilus]KGA96768.1 hypothetical protein BALCAV_0214235 [Alkalihalobacillus alcalophilus ATCC 27647 = CGMCC 1.3604]MED1563511.1 hypothetical protein [Alkalihalobacillus alcalophilus]THG92067.1 hypothetical protein AJ85_18165 [Alkalihalobacillus alcalophilus ATCC 27647 = CGMCC 1.3604]